MFVKRKEKCGKCSKIAVGHHPEPVPSNLIVRINIPKMHLALAKTFYNQNDICAPFVSQASHLHTQLIVVFCISLYYQHLSDLYK